jgi:hypothetical protein
MHPFLSSDGGAKAEKYNTVGWEIRRGNFYYYRKRRVNGRVRSIYFGSGLRAQIAAQQDERAKAERERQKMLRDYKRSPGYKETLARMVGCSTTPKGAKTGEREGTDSCANFYKAGESSNY